MEFHMLRVLCLRSIWSFPFDRVQPSEMPTLDFGILQILASSMLSSTQAFGNLLGDTASREFVILPNKNSLNSCKHNGPKR